MTFAPVSLIEQRRLNLRSWAFLTQLAGILMVATTVAAGYRYSKSDCTFHRGDFSGADFSDDFDIDRTICQLQKGKLLGLTANGIYFDDEKWDQPMRLWAFK